MSTSLKYVYVRSNNGPIPTSLRTICGKKLSLIEHLTLFDIRIDLEVLYSLAPALRTLDIMLTIYYPAHKFHLNPPENLKRLSLNIYHLYFSTIEQLLHPMTKLTDLIIIANDVYYDMTDGVAWERILSKIISFKFSFNFHKSTWTEEPIKLDSFQSLFWLEKKQWYVGYDRCTVSGFSLLYSIPYFMNKFPWHAMKGTIDTKSTGPQILSLNNINRFTINEQLPIDYKCLRRLINLEELVIKKFEEIFHILLDNIVPYIDMSRITTFVINEHPSKINIDSFVQFVSTMSHLRSLSASITLIKTLFISPWPNIRRLKILLSCPTATITEKTLTPNETDVFYRSFTHIEYLSFYHVGHLNPSILLKNIPTSISAIVVHHPIGITFAEFPDFITCDWLDQNTYLRNYFYSCSEWGVVSLWL